MALGVSFNATLLATIAQTMDDAYERWQIAVAEAQAGTYTGDKAAIDAVLGLKDYVTLLTVPLTLLDNRVSYVVPFVFPQGTVTQTRDISFPDLGYTPAATNIDHSSGPGGGKTLPSADITLTYVAASRKLTVDLQNLDNLTTLGTYTGELHDPADPSKVVGVITLTVN